MALLGGGIALSGSLQYKVIQSKIQEKVVIVRTEKYQI